MVDSDTSTCVIDRIKSIFSSDKSVSSLGHDYSACTHETKNLCPTEGHDIWHLKDSYLEGEPYWTATDAAFQKCRTRVKEYKCLGCGEERTITTGEPLETRWKEDMGRETLAEFHEKAKSGGWHNGQMWWEDNVWDGDATEVAPEIAWYHDVGYTDWKEKSSNHSIETGSE